MALPYLGKTETNQYQGYNYVSIDTYYDKVAGEALKRGLTWSMKELAVNTYPGDRFAFTYSFTLHNVDGDDVPDIDRVTITHPWQGAQTSGSARSYAEKLFMRSLFKVRTGEGDADASNQNDQPEPRTFTRDHWPRPEEINTAFGGVTLDQTWGIGDPEPTLPAKQDFSEVVAEYKDGYPIMGVPKPNDVAVHQWDIVTACFDTFIGLCENDQELQQFWTDNHKILDMMKARAQNDYAHVKEVFKRRGEQLTSNADPRK